MIKQDPHSFANFEQGLIRNIAFKIEIDFETRTLSLLVTYQLDRAVTGSLFLDTRDIQIERIHQGKDDLKWELDVVDPILGERLHIKELDSVKSFTIRCKTSPSASALQWLSPEQTAGNRHPFLYTQCQAIHARSVFPCQDSPSVRFTYKATVTASTDLKTVMAAELIEESKQGTITRSTFRMPQPIPSYLFALAVGDLEFREIGPRTGVYAESELIDAAAWEFGENELKLSHAEQLLGPYLWDRYDLLIMPPAFPFGGMENPRLTFLSSTAIVGDRSLSDIVTHELAHAWSGNLVTNATWEDFWLNEGWTTYIEGRITESMEGKEIKHLTRHRNRKMLERMLEYRGFDSPISCLKTSLNGMDPEDALTLIPYHKGDYFLQRIEQVVGRERFDRFVHDYMSTHQFSSISTARFLDYLREKLPKIDSKIDIDTWVFRPGLPDDLPEHKSALYEEVVQALQNYSAGNRPDRDTIGGWNRLQKMLFLEGLAKLAPIPDCEYFEGLFDIRQSDDPELQMWFFMIAIPSEYKLIRMQLERLVETVGRILILATLFRQMCQVEWTREFTRSLFETHRDQYHPITVDAVDRVLAKAGL
jgi:aminopeptidase N